MRRTCGSSGSKRTPYTRVYTHTEDLVYLLRIPGLRRLVIEPRGTPKELSESRANYRVSQEGRHFFSDNFGK